MAKIIFDSGAGYDSALALMLALSSGKIDIVGVTAAAGPEPVDTAVDRLLRALAAANKNIPVARGAIHPIARPFSAAAEPKLPDDILPRRGERSGSPMSALELHKLLLRESRGKVTFLCAGALTNIALLLLDSPELARGKIERIIVAGGAADGGDATACAERNFRADPEAAKIVFSFGVPVTLCGLDVCRTAYITKKQVRSVISRIDTDRARLCAALISQSCGALDCDSAYLKGATAVLYLVEPELFRSSPAAVDVETSSEWCDGYTLCRIAVPGMQDGIDRPHTVVTSAERAGYFELLVSLLSGRCE